MKKALLILFISCILLLASCGEECNHRYTGICDATCDDCGAEREITHDYAPADCTAPKTCENCGATEGDPLGHTPDRSAPTDTAPQKCSRCGKILAPKLPHTCDFTELKYDESGHWLECVCGEESSYGRSSHDPDDGDCTTAHVCSCGYVVKAAAEHEAVADDGNCKTPVACKNCEKNAIESYAEHNDTDRDYTCDNADCQITVDGAPKDGNDGIDLPIDYIAREGSAAASAVAEFVGMRVNLGGDISLKLYVKINDGATTQNDLSVSVEFLGERRTLEDSFAEGEYLVFTLLGISPQCMGNVVNARIYAGEAPVEQGSASLADYTVEKNLENIYSAADQKTKQLIDALRVYGKASERFTKHTSMVGDYSANEIEVPESRISFTDTTPTVALGAVSVGFGSANYIKMSLDFLSGTATDISSLVTVNGKAPTEFYIDGSHFVIVTDPISPDGFNKDVKLVYNGTDGTITLDLNINDYCYEITKQGSIAGASAKSLAKALYSYGLAAHAFVGHSYESGYCVGCGAAETYSLKFGGESGVEIVGTPTPTYGSDLAVELENIASASRADLKFNSVEIGDVHYSLNISNDSSDPTVSLTGNTLFIPGELIKGDVVIYAYALASIKINLNGGNISSTFSSIYVQDGDVACCVDAWSTYGSWHPFDNARFTRDGYTFVKAVDQNGNDVTGGVKITEDIVVNVIWEEN